MHIAVLSQGLLSMIVGSTVFTFLTYSATAAKNYIIHPVRVVLQRCHITVLQGEDKHSITQKVLYS